MEIQAGVGCLFVQCVQARFGTSYSDLNMKTALFQYDGSLIVGQCVDILGLDKISYKPVFELQKLTQQKLRYEL